MPQTAWLSTVYQQYRRELFLAAWTVLRRVDLAEDAVHSAFVKMARFPAPPDDPKLYALRAVRNSAIDLIKARSRRREVSLPDGWDAASAESIPVDAEVMQSLVKLLDALDPRSREVIELHLHAALTFQEISLVLEEPLSTVASRYRRALEKVGKEMKVRYE